jgi:hypothetical protein
LHVTVLADAEQGMVSHDPKFSFCHAPSLRCPPRRSSPVEIKLHHYLFSGSGAVGVGTIESCEGGPGHAFPEPSSLWCKSRCVSKKC